MTIYSGLKMMIFHSYVSLPGGNAICQWIVLRENLQETMVLTTKYRVFRFQFSLKPIL